MTRDEQKALLREKRSNEGNFDELLKALQHAIQEAEEKHSPETANSLKEIREKQALAYTTAKQNSGTAWPEFEQFVSAWEKVLMADDE